MAPKRVPLAAVSANQAPRKELTPFERGQIQGLATAGLKPAEIKQVLKRPVSTIKDALQNSCQNPNGKSLPRSGRPSILTYRERRLLIREALWGDYILLL